MDGKPKLNYKDVGLRIRKARETAGLTQAQLAEKLTSELTPTAISFYESGLREVSLPILEDIAEKLNVPLDFFIITGDENGPSINIALRADKELTPQARKQVLDFIDFVKKKSQ